jgi:hypothetical protein
MNIHDLIQQNESDMRQRFKVVKPLVVHLVTEGEMFEQAIIRYQGNACWFEALDRRADPEIAEILRTHFDQGLSEPLFKGLTPETRSLYHLVARHIPKSDETRLKQALQLGGGQLQQYRDRGDYWAVDWITADSIHHTSAIAKSDLTVISSGICLSGRDRDFDLQSLVGVMEHQEP